MIEYISKNKARFRVNVGSGKERKVYTKTVNITGKKDAEKQFRDFESTIREGYKNTSMNVSALLDWYIESCELLGVAKTTAQGYKSTRKWIDAELGKINIQNLTPYHINKMVSKMSRNGRTPKTIKNTISLLNASYKKAIKSRLAKNNPCSDVDIPKQRKPEIKVFSPHETSLFLKALEGESLDFRVACKLGLFCGMRRSEILGLEECHVDIKNRRIYIMQARKELIGKDVIEGTKTEKSTRVLALPEVLVSEIEELIEAHHNQPFETCSFLLQDGFGMPMKHNYLTKHIMIVNKKNGLPPITFHGLRHTYASALHNRGEATADISAQLGHSTIVTTLNTYTHVLGGVTQSGERIASEMDAYIRELQRDMQQIK